MAKTVAAAMQRVLRAQCERECALMRARNVPGELVAAFEFSHHAAEERVVSAWLKVVDELHASAQLLQEKTWPM